jgi:DNA-binding transcriptional ArsR family regulator
VSAAKPSSEEVVAKTLASGHELTGAEIAAATGLGRSTVGNALAALERTGVARRHPGRRDGRRRVPDRWSVGRMPERDMRARASASRLRPGQLDGLVLGYIESQDNDAVGTAAAAKALGRSAGAVANCLTRLTAAGRCATSAASRTATAAPPPHRARARAVGERRSHEGNRIRVAR